MRSAAAALLLACQALTAQGEAERSSELSRTQRLLQQNRSEVERLIDARLRHDLGLPGDEADATQRSGPAPTTEAMERSRQELRDQDATTAQLLERYNQLKAAVEQLRTETAAQMDARQAEEQFVVVPTAGAAAPRQGASGTPRQAPPAAAGPETAPAPEPPPPLPMIGVDLDPLRGQIHGSTDHLQVAHSLFKAAQMLMDRAATLRDQKQLAGAEVLDARAKEKLTRALDELAPLLEGKDPALPVLFYQGRCRELLFRLAERHEGLSLGRAPTEYQKREQQVRDPFLAVTARDVQKQGARGENEVMGMWGLAAQTAMDHFVWINRNASYMPKTPIGSITWSGEQER
jgi:hypothetical protein